MWELDHRKSWALKNRCFWTVLLKKTLKSPLESKEIKPVNPKGNQSWIIIGRTDVKTETLILWPSDAKNWLIGKDPDAGKDWRQEETGMTKNEMVGWHHRLNRHEFEQATGDSDGQGSLTCCRLWGHKVRHDWVTELNWLNRIKIKPMCSWSQGWSHLMERADLSPTPTPPAQLTLVPCLRHTKNRKAVGFSVL